MSFRRPPREPLDGVRDVGVPPHDPPTDLRFSCARAPRELSSELFARIEASARGIAERIERERATAAELWAELARTPSEAWPALAASGRFALPTFVEDLCEAGWSLSADRSEAWADFGHQVACQLDSREVGAATASGLLALTRASLGDAWRRLGRLDEADLAFSSAFSHLTESEDSIDLGLVLALYSRSLRDRGELPEAYFDALCAAQHLRREGIAALAAGAWGEVAALAAEIGACGRVDAALKAARREIGNAAQEAAARAVARGVLRLLLLRRTADAVALARAARRRLAPDPETRAALTEITAWALVHNGSRAESGRALAAAAHGYALAGRPIDAVALGFELALRGATERSLGPVQRRPRSALRSSVARLSRLATGTGLPLSLRLSVALWCRTALDQPARAA
ncbi:MAG TPA: hypothetical protein VN851_23230, partial [Thermoanaerobaculia bacterium]|nr:hypothetical protein [Thermoanaerobaculia bacterium]